MRKGRILFCDNWKFALTEPDSTKEELKGVHWYNVEVPHDWLIGDPRNLYKSGTGWYRKSFNIEETELSDSFILCFDGVYMDTTVYINGKEAGEWKYGYTSFSFDISQYLVSGENEVLVRVNHKAPNTRWYSGAGIYRNVYLRHTNSRYIAEDGVYISTKCNYHINNKNPGRWRVCIETEFNAELDGVVAHRITDPDGKEVYFAERRVCGCSDKAVFFTDTPVLWDIYEPNLYTVTTTLLTEKGEVLDEVQNDFGYRTTEFSSEKGFSLNCMGLKLRGVCMHHDLGALGAAVNFDATLRQLLTLKAMGVNAVRTSHNPPSREFMDICDRIGLLVVSEFVDMWEMPKSENDYSRFFPQWYKTDVRAWVRRDRNHPSLIMWSLGNEIQDTHESERGLEIAKALYAEVQKHDPYKNAETTIASNYMPWENAQKVADHVKIAGYNYAERLYNEHHKAHPDWVIFGSETASTVRSRGIYRFPAEVQQLTHDDMQCSDLLNSVVEWGANPVTSYLMDRDADLSMGQFVWTGFDYIGEPTPYSTKSSYFGIVDTAGIPKDSYYLYKALWDKGAEPFIHLLPHWDYNEGQTVDVFAYSNLPVLELTYGEKTYKKQIIDVN
ncbi:MAG: beta-galactosidase, partial [Ruminiclostridium sp.]|nr:beta-galactosidase [Ruminiclostridium sp.]